MTPNTTYPALAAPNLWGQVYLGCRWLYGLTHADSEAVASDACRAFEDDLCINLDDLHYTINEIARAD